MNHLKKALGSVAVGTALAGSLFSCKPANKAEASLTKKKNRPNVLFIMTDDHAYQAIGAYGSKINKTPNLDRLANEGMRFDKAYVTNSICGPSRAVVLTGKYSHMNGKLDNRIPFDGSQQTFPKLFQKAGYQTAIVGKWHLYSEPTGFDYWNILPGQGEYYNPDFIEMGERKRLTGYCTDLTTDIALEWLDKKRDSGKPFMMMLHHKAPHRSWQPAERHLNLYDDQKIPEPETLFEDYKKRGGASAISEMSIVDHMRDGHDLKLEKKHASSSGNKWHDNSLERLRKRMNEAQRKAWENAYGPKNEAYAKANLKGEALLKWKYQRYIKDYLRCIASVDENIGRVLEYLEKKGQLDNTLIIYTSDQGFYLGEHGWFDKRFMYEESFRTPLLIRYPKLVKPGSVSKEMCMNLDFAPTMLDIAGLDIPWDVQGESMKPLLANAGVVPDSVEWRNSMYYHYYEFPGSHNVSRHYGVSDGKFKLIRFYKGAVSWELYDLENDPKEMKNLYNDPAYAKHISRLKKELKRLQIKYKDPASVGVPAKG
ncbi:N-acetylglucosamine-6-sulfatase (plasmid) [Fulvitalea axinellae]|uniref:N-acetylglucosamine-6-sulfatase n=1 Tax=Fulvitalea axinellae TaxID=1182444 RepID=A0AAU9DI00_9BACT|nr:N-acetylglucosamine-6-sulfatase [Fulvitalea axinellae]